MALDKVNLGANPDDGNGDTLRDGGVKINTAFDAVDANTDVTEHITVTQDVNLDTMESDIAANTAKVSFPEAPIDGNDYVRRDAAWEIATGGGAVDSVNGQTGVVVLDTDDVAEGVTNLYYTDVRVSANTDVTANTAKNSYPSADATKVGFITVTGSVDLDQIDTDVATNNAKVSNATHTGDVAGSTTLTIQPNAVKDSMIDFGTGANQVSTADIPEDTNLYYTEGRVSANPDVSANTAKISYTDAATVSGHTTDINNLKQDYWSLEFTGDPIERSYRLVAHSDKALTIDKIEGITTSGTISAQVTINGVNVTGAVITASSTIQTGTATALNSVVATDSVEVLLSSNSSAVDLHLDVYFTEA